MLEDSYLLVGGGVKEYSWDIKVGLKSPVNDGGGPVKPRLLGFNKDEGTVLSACEGTPKCQTLHKGSAILGQNLKLCPCYGDFSGHIQKDLRVKQRISPKSWLNSDCKLPEFRQDDVQDVSMINETPVGIWCQKKLINHKRAKFCWLDWFFTPKKTTIQSSIQSAVAELMTDFPQMVVHLVRSAPFFFKAFELHEALSFTQSYEKKK